MWGVKSSPYSRKSFESEDEKFCEDLWPLTSKTLHPDSKVSIKRLSASAICSSTPDKSSIFPPERSDRRPARLQGRQATNLDACAAPAPAVRNTHVNGLPIQIQLGAQSPCLHLNSLFTAEPRRERVSDSADDSSTSTGSWTHPFQGRSLWRSGTSIPVRDACAVGLRRGGVVRDNARQATYSHPSCSTQTRDEKL